MAQARAISSPAPAAANPLKVVGVSSIGELAVPIAVLLIVIALITPLPSFMLDILLVLDLMMSVIVMMVAMYIGRPVEFSVFPTVLLLLTLFRLALNVSSSRLILLNGNTGTSAAGHVIEAFGSFVVGGNYIIGAVIFCVLIAIQYVVINHGSVRISEVTARFTLDALPGKQMSIDADLNGGLIDETEARRRRRDLSSEAEFYGAMDGASRFTQRDAIASIIITGVNIVAGFLIGVLQHSMDLGHALQTYTVLTIGDGLVTVIPALMISISGGLIVTRASSDSKLGAQFQAQIFGKSEPLLLASGVLVALSLFPGLPTIPFLLLGGGLGTVAWRMRRKNDAAVKTSTESAEKPAKENVEALLQVDPLMVEVGLGLVKLVEGGANSKLLQRIAGIRKNLASQLGYYLPPVKVNDNLSLRSREYALLIKGVEMGRYEMPAGQELAIPSAGVDGAMEGKPTKDPAFQLAALWIPSERAALARSKGYTVVDDVSVMGTHLSEVVRRHAHELFSRQDTKNFCDRVAQGNPKVVEDLVPKMLSLSVIQRVLQNLLRERVPIRDSVTILEALSEGAQMTKNPVLLTEYVRQSIRRAIVSSHVTQQGELAAYMVEPSAEHAVEAAVEHSEHNSVLGMAPQSVRDLVGRITRKLERPDSSAVVLVNPSIRYFVKQLLETAFPDVTVLSHSEVPPEIKIKSLGWVG
ncbi:MAG TPA: flagellar biosynthesis protein FlhA [Bryobacteraceae bacterium]|jgi:flagellar biosynthesis protein FlhA|nr:flagellar biosynthesis protein FlhA [Bryobacteraceae bacterium]